MSTSRGPTVRQRRLGIELRRLRENSRLTGDDVAAHLSWSTAKVSRLENARTGARVEDVAELLKLYGVNGSRLDELIALANDATKRGWWEEYPSLHPGYAEFIALESEAGEALQWENLIVPGLLQAESYARQIIRGWDAMDRKSPAEIQRWIDVRLKRQQVLHRAQPLRMSVVLDESVLLRRIGSAAVMAEQVEHLARASLLPNVSVRILPLGTPRSLATPSFTLLRFAPAHDVTFPDIVHIESVISTYLENEQETHMHRLAYQEIERISLDEHRSRQKMIGARELWLATG